MANPTDQGRLSSWKEISEFLHCDVTTAHRWERERGLPVRRVPGGRKSSVFAYREELEEWLKGGVAPPRSGKTPRSVWTRRAVVAGAGIGIGGAAFGLRRMFHRGNPEKATLSSSTITALDVNGNALWEYRLPERAIEDGRDRDLSRRNWRIRVVDVEGSGRPGVLAAVTYPGEGNSRESYRDELLLLSADGELRWRYPVAPDLRDPTGATFESLWYITDLMLTREAAGHAVWVAVGHQQRWPSCVVRLDGTGKPEVRYANSGQIYKLTALRSSPGRLILAGGISNAYEKACLAVFGAGDPPSVAPVGGPPRYRYANAPAGSPRHFLLFPTTELSVASNRPYTWLHSVGANETVIQVQTMEGDYSCNYCYEFTTDLKPKVVRIASPCEPYHKKLEAAGALKHPLAQCPQFAKPAVLDWWQPSTGWRKVEIPWATMRNVL